MRTVLTALSQRETVARMPVAIRFTIPPSVRLGISGERNGMPHGHAPWQVSTVDNLDTFQHLRHSETDLPTHL